MKFPESGYGKGVPDGIGGVLQRTAIAKVLQGHDIQDAKSFLQTLQNANLNIDVRNNTTTQSSLKYHETTPDHHRPIRTNFL